MSLSRQRSLEALKQKARRGELFLTVAVGYLKTAHDRIEKNPDRRVQEAIGLVFARFAELQTVRQVLLWMRQRRLTASTLSDLDQTLIMCGSWDFADLSVWRIRARKLLVVGPTVSTTQH